MQTSSREFLLMMISTLSASWCDGINRVCEACFVNSPERTSRSPMTWHRILSCVPTKTSAVFAVKPVSRLGFIALPTIAFEKMRDGVRNLSESMKSNCNPRTIPRSPILVSDTILCMR